MLSVFASTSMISLVQSAITSSSWLEQSVLLVLVLFSIVSWALILMKWRALSRAALNNQQFLSVFEAAADVKTAGNSPGLEPSPLLAIYKAALEAWETSGGRGGEKQPDVEEKLTLRMQHASRSVFADLRWGLSFLASVSSASPFIGLFGTVWGIMATFQNLGDAKSASLAVVAPGISSALIATAAGLAVAIPAVMAYNWLLGRIDDIQESADIFSERLSYALRHGATPAGQPMPEVLREKQYHTPLALKAVQAPPETETTTVARID